MGLWYYLASACLVVLLQVLAYLALLPVVLAVDHLRRCALAVAMSCASYAAMRYIGGCRDRLELSIAGMNKWLGADPHVMRVVDLVIESSYRRSMESRGGTPTHSGLARWSRERRRPVSVLVVGVARGLSHGMITRSQAALIMGDAVSVLSAASDRHPRSRLKGGLWGS